MNRELMHLTTGQIYAMYDEGLIDLNPWYQRPPGLWNAAKKSDFIGCLLNNISPGLFFYHKFEDNRDNGVHHQVDGKQRVWDLLLFRMGQVKLPLGYVYEANPEINLSRKSWQELERDHPEVLRDLMGKQFACEILSTNDIRKIAIQFVKLNSNKPVTAKEVRHAVAGAAMDWVRTITDDRNNTIHPFLDEKVKVKNGSYHYEDFMTRILYMETHNTLAGLNRNAMDQFAHEYAAPEGEKLRILRDAQHNIVNMLDIMNQIFSADNNVFSRVSAIPSYYWVIRNLVREETGWTGVDIRNFFDQFTQARQENNHLDPVYRNQALVHYALLMMQGSTRTDGIKDRYTILSRFAEEFKETGNIDVNTEINMDDLVTYSNITEEIEGVEQEV